MNEAVEFAKWMLGKSVAIKRNMNEPEHIYHPPEYNLMMGNLIQHGDELYQEFLTCNRVSEEEVEVEVEIPSKTITIEIKLPEELNEVIEYLKQQ